MVIVPCRGQGSILPPVNSNSGGPGSLHLLWSQGWHPSSQCPSTQGPGSNTPCPHSFHHRNTGRILLIQVLCSFASKQQRCLLDIRSSFHPSLRDRTLVGGPRSPWCPPTATSGAALEATTTANSGCDLSKHKAIRRRVNQLWFLCTFNTMQIEKRCETCELA